MCRIPSTSREAVRSGKLAGADLASSYCLRSSAHSELGQSDKAIADADEALKLTPNSSTTPSCRASAYFAAGEFDKSVADHSGSIALGNTDAKALQQRGISKFYAGRLEEAAEDFAKAANDTTDREGQVYSDLWLAWTHLRLGKALPDELLKRAAEEPTGGWPRPARAVLTGKLAPEEMLKLLERKTGDERRMAKSEGYFYLGQYYLGRGDKAKAREYFEKARRANIIIYTEAHRRRLRVAAAGDREPRAGHHLVDCGRRSRKLRCLGPKCRCSAAACHEKGGQQASSQEVGVLDARSLEVAMRCAGPMGPVRTVVRRRRRGAPARSARPRHRRRGSRA